MRCCGCRKGTPSFRPHSPTGWWPRSGQCVQSDGPVLSERERQVLNAFSRGLSIPQTAAELILGVGTVKTYTQRLYEKLGVSDRAAAVAEAMRRGLLD